MYTAEILQSLHQLLSYRRVQEILPLCVALAKGFLMSPRYLWPRGLEQRIREIDFNLAGDFLIVSECGRQEKEDGPDITT